MRTRCCGESWCLTFGRRLRQQVAFFFCEVESGYPERNAIRVSIPTIPSKERDPRTSGAFSSICSRHCVCVVLREQRKTHSANLPERVVRFNFLIQCPRACEVSNKNMFMQSVSIFDFSIPSLPLTPPSPTHTHTHPSLYF